jgi:hypothetical protein
MKWESNTASYSHNIVLNSDQDSWRRLVFITADKTSHTLKIFPTNSAGSVLYMTDAMVWDGDLESVSNIYNSCIVGIRKQGNYRDDNGLTLGGTWNRSDKIYYAAPVSLGAIGVVNTAAGSPGTFTEFGQVY